MCGPGGGSRCRCAARWCELLGGFELTQVQMNPRGRAIHACAFDGIAGFPPVVRLSEVAGGLMGPPMSA